MGIQEAEVGRKKAQKTQKTESDIQWIWVTEDVFSDLENRSAEVDEHAMLAAG